MKRRTFIAGLGSAVAWPLVVPARSGTQKELLDDGIATLMGSSWR
jgi:hypothetical protein